MYRDPEHLEQVKNDIRVLATNEFIKKGVKAVKMNDLAQTLRISKRTIYEIYKDKESLLFSVVKNQIQKENLSLKSYYETHNAIETIVEFYNRQVAKSLKVNPVFFKELHSYVKVTEYLKKKHEERHNDGITFFENGVKDGYFKNDLNFRVSLSVIDYTLANMRNDNQFDRMTVDSLFRNYILVLVRGMCTQKGLELLDRLL
ncbi:TetR/AcrR family transcriptional regulator [Segatella albensis]|jgi:AcrR family transcriptional regulator|uniref:TetR/AcrR family transcriptional regulator n=1 Tax=Segatella albensis TaxID=77768 RepID=UPI0003FED1D1|nr:TetR/AcrR family transcriptional regulator [Segatella albensis]